MINQKLSIYKKDNDLQFKDFDINNLKSLLATQYQELENENKTSIKIENEKVFNNFIELIKLKKCILELNASLKQIPLLENIDNIVSITNETFLNLETLPKNIISDVINDIVEKKSFSPDKSDEYLVYVISLNLNININFNNRKTIFNSKYDFFINDWEKEDGKYNISYLSHNYTDNQDFFFDFTSLKITEDQLKKFLLEKLDKLTKKSKKNLLLAQIIRDKKVKIKLDRDPEYGIESVREIIINANDSDQFSNTARIIVTFKTRTNINQYNWNIPIITFNNFNKIESDLKQKLIDAFETNNKPILLNVLNDSDVQLGVNSIYFGSSWYINIKVDATNSKKYYGSASPSFTAKINDIDTKYISISNTTTTGYINFSSLKSNDSLYITTTLKHLYLITDNNKPVLNSTKIQEFDNEIVGLEVDHNKNWYVATKDNKLYSGQNNNQGQSIASFDEEISKITLYDENNLYVATKSKNLYSYNLTNKTKKLLQKFEFDITKMYINENKYYVGLNNGDLYYGESIQAPTKIQSLKIMIRDIALDKNNNLYVVTTGNLYAGKNNELNLIQKIYNASVITFDNKNNWFVGAADGNGKIYYGKSLTEGKYFMQIHYSVLNITFINSDLVVNTSNYLQKINYDFDNNYNL